MPKITIVKPMSPTLVQDTEGTGVTGPRIRCPLCNWSPTNKDTWACECGNMFNTFETGGICPQCMKDWKRTQCHSCHQWSAHSDWYEY